MDATHFGLRQRPFRTTPDSEFYYPATSHERALARLLQAIVEDEGLALLTGDPGSGKTLLCHRLLERLGPEINCAFLTNSHIPNRLGLLQAILYDWALPYEGRAEQELRLALTDFLLANFASGKRNVLIVDEAQHLGPDLLEELRLLGNLEARRGRALQVILVAQSSIWDTLQQLEMTALRQRLAVRVHLEPLGVAEATDYLLHHLRAAGGRPEAIVSEEALELLARVTNGLPRLLNQSGQEALELADRGGATCVDAEVAMEVLQSMGLEITLGAARTETVGSLGGDVEAVEPQNEQVAENKDLHSDQLQATNPPSVGTPARRWFPVAARSA